MSNLSTQSKNIWLTIRKNREINTDKIKEWLNLIGCEFYAFIEHKCDWSPTLQKEEGCHYHLAFCLLKRRRLSTILTDCVDYLGLVNANGVDIEVCKEFAFAIQYLIHKNDQQKTQHSKDEIITTLSVEELDAFLTTENVSLSYERILSICLKATCILDVIQQIGFTRYHIYRHAIKDIYEYVSLHRNSPYIQEYIRKQEDTN